MTREQQRKACEDARKLRLKLELSILESWCAKRVEGDAPAADVLKFLEWHVADIRRAVDRAGMQAISEVDTETWP